MSKQVQNMFSSIARRYDLANDVLSFGIHRIWRKRALKQAGVASGDTLLDLCTGTGDVALEAAGIVGEKGKIIGMDFVYPMLQLAQRKSIPCMNGLTYIQGDAMQLPFADSCTDFVSISFGIRNVDQPSTSLKEIQRVLRAGGKAIIIEFGQPTLPVFKHLYNFYCTYLMPLIGGILTGNRQAYSYLPKTSREFPAGASFVTLMEEAGFAKISSTALLFGLAYIYIGSSQATRD